MDFNIMNFRVINPDLISYSTSQIRITTTYIGFNIATAAELGYPEKVCLLATEDGRALAIQSAETNDSLPFSIPFFDKEEGTKKLIRIKDKQFVHALRNERGWFDKASRLAPGILYRAQKLILFNLDECIRASDKGKKDNKEISLTDYPKLNEVITKLQPRQLLLQPASV